MGTFKTGQVLFVDDSISGSVNIIGTGVVNYSVSNLITLIPGQYISGNFFGGILHNVIPLDEAWIDSLVTINSSNLLPLEKVQSALIAAKICAVNKGANNLIDQQGQCCIEDESIIRQMMNLSDSIECVIPEGEIISGRQAIYSFTANSTAGAKVVEIHIGNAIYSFTSFTGNGTDFAKDIARYINSLYPQNYSYQAKADIGQVLVWGNNFDEDNGTVITATTTNGSFTLPTPLQLNFGTAKVLQGQNQISNNDIQIILNKICTLCKN